MRAHALRARIIVTIVAMAAAMVLVPAPALAAEYSCDLAGLDQAITDGGPVHTFDCAGPTVIQTPGDYLILSRVVELDGEGLLTIEVQPDPVSRLFGVGGPGAELILHNLAITGGDVGNDSGGALIVGGGGQIHLHNVEIYGSSAGEGGAVGVEPDGFLRVFESSLHDNTAGDGGAISVQDGEALIQGSSIMNNAAVGPVRGRTGFGGGIFAFEGAQVRVENSNVEGNSSVFVGGGIAALSSDLWTVEASISGNYSDVGGGAYVRNATADIQSTAFEGNSSHNGGAIYAADALLTIGDSWLAGNSVTESGFPTDDGNGGAILAVGGAGISIVDTGIVDNTAEDGGGVWSDRSTVTIQRTLIAGNAASDEIGGLANLFGVLMVDESALLGNSSGRGDAGAVWHGAGGGYIVATSVTNSCIVDNSFPALGGSSTGVRMATGNWWGDASGPSGDGPGSGDGVLGGWDFGSWADDLLPACVFAEAPWAPGQPATGTCEILMWFDDAEVITDTDTAPDDWLITGAARFYDFDETRDREIASIGLTAFTADAGDVVTLEQQWRTEMWDHYANKVRLDDLSVTVREDDGRMGDDLGTFRWSPGLLIECGETTTITALIGVNPGAARGQISTDTYGLIELDITITAVPAMNAPPPQRR